ncbi:hypothetical protein CCUS01_12102 [Colletotrichum cuscutae]|uniref:Uncharacterized protein n=1 Tax=Colletotrichum cuscutae TaxID=1209917 RepID=A0AAI9XG01_9PEZI|nr:hypothetical protein CCUS01_12102 [Colletotrichum cuscutae]
MGWDGMGREGRRTRCHRPFKHQPECHRQPNLEGLTPRMVGKGRHQTKDVPADAGRGAGAGLLRTLGADTDADADADAVAVASCGQPGEGTVEMEPTCMPWNPKTLESQVPSSFLPTSLPSLPKFPSSFLWQGGRGSKESCCRWELGNGSPGAPLVSPVCTRSMMREKQIFGSTYFQDLSPTIRRPSSTNATIHHDIERTRLALDAWSPPYVRTRF